MPSRGLVTAETLSSFITTGMDGLPFMFATCVRKPVDEARNILADQTAALLEYPERGAFIADEMFVLWIDDDAFWPPGAVASALRIMKEHQEIDILSGFFGPRGEYGDATLWYGERLREDGDVVEVLHTGMHWVMHRASVLDRVGPAPFSCFGGLTEDLSFSKRARNAGLRIFVAKSIVIPHIDAEKGLAYVPGREAFEAHGTFLSTRSNPRSYGPAVDAVYRAMGQRTAPS
jgi:GT2 family glycosyltransferase